MKNLRPELIELLKKGYCTPRLSSLAVKTGSKATTIHYNIKQMEGDGVVKTYKAVLNHSKIGEGFCTFVLINLDRREYKTPEEIGKMLAKYPQVESVDIITGGWEIIVKVRTKDIEGYYEFSKKALLIRGIDRTQTLSSLLEIKSEFVG